MRRNVKVWLFATLAALIVVSLLIGGASVWYLKPHTDGKDAQPANALAERQPPTSKPSTYFSDHLAAIAAAAAADIYDDDVDVDDDGNDDGKDVGADDSATVATSSSASSSSSLPSASVVLTHDGRKLPTISVLVQRQKIKEVYSHVEQSDWQYVVLYHFFGAHNRLCDGISIYFVAHI